uniref:Core domain-containing protein n=1 Tax=Cucumis melo TaxID=3656 RepID=A0A9I9DMG9_CUCME
KKKSKIKIKIIIPHPDSQSSPPSPRKSPSPFTRRPDSSCSVAAAVASPSFSPCRVAALFFVSDFCWLLHPFVSAHRFLSRQGSKLKREHEGMGPRSLIQRVTPYLVARIKENQRLLSSSATAYQEASSLSSSPSPSPSAPVDTIHMTDSCIRRMKELQDPKEEKMLRLSVETGGCSGFQYVFNLDGKTTPDDRIYEKEGVKLVVDNISYDFVKGATIDYVEELIRSAFVVSTNPSAVGGCSCKSSFMVKQ